MTDGIGRLTGYGNYGVGGYVPHRRNGEEAAAQAEEQQAQAQQPEAKKVDPNKVMEFLANNNYFVAQTQAPAPVDGVETDPTIADRVAGYMENFELIYGVIEQEFGTELAPAVMDMVMDRLMGMV